MERIRSRAGQKGYTGVAGLLRSLGLHRNTLNRYADGAGVLPRSVELVIEALQLPLADVIEKRREPLNSNSLEPIAALIDQLNTRFPQYSFVLFGSRARTQARKYSDFDIGVVAPGALPFADFSQMLELKEEFETESSFFVDLVDLSRADKQFLESIAPEVKLLSGRYSDFSNLQKRVQYAIG